MFSRSFGYGEMLFEEAPGGSPLKRYSREVLATASRGRKLVEQILAYSRTQLGERSPVDLAGVVAEALELLQGERDGQTTRSVGALKVVFTPRPLSSASRQSGVIERGLG
jgi:signal transduction histidine kinase